MIPTLAIARTTFREAVRHRGVVWPSLLLAGIVLLAGETAFFAFGEEARMIREVAASLLATGTTAIAVLVATSALDGEMQDGASLLLFVKPSSRAEILLGKLLGSVLSAMPAAMVTSLAVVVTLALRGERTAVGPLAAAVALGIFQATIVASTALTLSIVVHRAAAGLLAAFVFVLGHLRPMLDLAPASGLEGGARFVASLVVPNLTALDATVAFGLGRSAGAMTLALGGLYAAVFACVAIGVGATLLERVEVRRA